MTRKYGQWAGRPEGEEEQPGRCIAEVIGSDGWPIYSQCSRKRGHGSDKQLCHQHAKALERGGHVSIPEVVL